MSEFHWWDWLFVIAIVVIAYDKAKAKVFGNPADEQEEGNGNLRNSTKQL